MQEYDAVEVDLPEKIQLLLDARDIDPATLVERAVNRMMPQLPITKERRGHLRLVTWD